MLLLGLHFNARPTSFLPLPSSPLPQRPRPQTLRSTIPTFSPSSVGRPKTLCSLLDSDPDPLCQNFPPTVPADVLAPSADSLPLQYFIREAHIRDFWQVADTHCGAFHPESAFPMDLILRLDRFLAMCGGLPLPIGCHRKCIIAVGSFPENGSKQTTAHALQLENTIMGALTVDTIGEFLPRRKSTGRRRTGIAYVSNMAVREKARRKGIARSLMQEAEQVAIQWGCHSIALHCNRNNSSALSLYVGAGYRIVKTPTGAKWPQPKTNSGEFCLLMKFLGFEGQ